MANHPSIYREQGKIYHADTCKPLVEAHKAGKVRLEALARGSYPGKRLEKDALPGIKSIGYWDATGSQDWGLDWHGNEGIEISYLEKGSLPFSVNSKQHSLHPDDLTITRPWQPHKLGNPHINASKLYWIILDVDVRRPNQPWKWPKWLILKKEDIKELTNLLRHNEQPVWRANPAIQRCFQKMGTAIETDRQGRNISFITLYLNEMLLHLLDLLRGQELNLNPDLSSTQRTIELFFNDLKTNRDTLSRPWTVESMAEQCGLGVTSFVHYCKQLFNTTPAQYLNQLRIKAATHMLNEEPNISITEIAYTCGFCSSQYFATVFKRIHGCRPKDFKKTQVKKRMISRN